MRPLRIPIAAILLLSWFTMYGFVVRNDVASNAELDVVARRLDDQDPLWAREDVFYVAANLDRTGSVLQRGSRRVLQGSTFRVLVLGDSFTVGQGMVDLDARWPNRLQASLDERYGTGVVEVTTLARRGASLTTYAGWLQDLANGRLDRLVTSDSKNAAQLPDELVESLRRPFDMILLGYVENDLITNHEDWFIPEGSHVNIPPDSEDDVITGRTPNPNEVHIRTALEYLVSAAPANRLAVLPLVARPLEDQRQYDHFDIVREYVPYVAPNTTQVDLGRRVSPERLMVNPVDSHPNAAFHAAIARDALAAVEHFFSTSPPPTTQKAPVDNLFSTMLPAPSSLSDTAIAATISFDGDPTPEHCTTIQSGPGRVHRCDPPRVELQDATYPPQYIACARLGIPHVFLMLNPGLTPGTEVRFSVESNRALQVYAFGYDNDSFEVFTPIELQGTTGVLRSSREATGLILADPSGTCSLDQPVLFPAFTLHLELV